MIGPGYFLCGCKIPENPRMDSVGAICEIHKAREYGWLSPSKSKADGGSTTDIARWAEITRTDFSEVSIIPDNVPDIRNNSNPEQIGEAILAKRNSKPKPEHKKVHTEDSKNFIKNHPMRREPYD